MSGRVTLLGPQRLAPTVGATLESLGVALDAPVATVTAGWQEREGDDQELDQHLGGRTVNLGLYRHAERVLEHDPELAGAIHERQRLLRRVQFLYRVRLDAALAACHEVFEMNDEDEPLQRARAAALETVRELDRRHLQQVTEVHAAFEARWRPGEREPLVHARTAVATALRGCAALAVAGGHVAVLLNRLRLFAVDAAARDLTVVAWSAGAMAMAEQVVLFHDDPPHGAGHPEAFELGLGLAAGVLPFPHARHRLRLDDSRRVGIAARRFAPAACVPMDEHARLDRSASGWSPAPGTRRFADSGAVTEWVAA